jgi:predicted NAD-dependent protein-ADP-ribosyltransferase YbiA (DUF1768 family)
MEKKVSPKIVKFYARKHGNFEFKNFYIAEIIVDGQRFASTEHYYQYQKFVGAY